MADKIASFEEYVKRESRKSGSDAIHKKETEKSGSDITPIKEAVRPESDVIIQEVKGNPEPESLPKKEEVKQETMDIQIEDPFMFLSEEEREEYLLHRKKEQEHLSDPKEKRHLTGREAGKTAADQEEKSELSDPKEKRRSVDSEENREQKPTPVSTDVGENRPHIKEITPQAEDDEDDPYADEDFDDDYEKDEEKNGARIERAVKIASVMTGIVILIFIALFLKTRVFDRFFVQQPEEEVVAEIVVPEGFTEKEDTVVVTGASSLNLRSGPGTQSMKITEVAEGTTLKRIAVSDDDSWAFVEYEGQYLYASMKYLTVQ